MSARSETVRAQGLVGGLHTEPVLVSQDRTQCGLHLELDSLGVRTVLGVSAAQLCDLVVGFDDLSRPALARLPDRLSSVSSWSERFDILDDVFAATAVQPRPVAAELAQAWRLLIGSGGRVRVADLADEIGCSRRYFGEKFRSETGLTPKQAARIVRFERAGTRMRRGRIGLATLAAECGYYDQAHLSNEWRSLAGCSPATWISEELPFLQDEAVFGDPH